MMEDRRNDASNHDILESNQEILGQLRVLDTKIGFLESDISELRELIGTLGETSTTVFAEMLVHLDALRNSAKSQNASSNNSQNRDNRG